MTIFADPKTLSHDDLEEGATFAPRFDAHGLITVVTIEEGTKDVLMVAYMNAETLGLTLDTGIAHYWSRSRKAIWKKGETSGELQEVVELRTDCDQDCLVMTVRQTGRGAACHTGRKSCFYRSVETENGIASLEDIGLPKLFDPKDVYGEVASQILRRPAIIPSVVIAWPVPAIHLASAWTTGTSPVVTTNDAADHMHRVIPAKAGM